MNSLLTRAAAKHCKRIIGNAVRNKTSFRSDLRASGPLAIRRTFIASEKPFGGRQELQMRPAMNWINTRETGSKSRYFSASSDDLMQSERESMPFDVLIVGGGPSGLAASIRLKQLCEENDVDLSVCVVEKGR